MDFHRGSLNCEELIEMYRRILLPRMIEEKMLSYLRQGRISKWFSGIGQEAIAVGCTMAIEPEERIYPMHRNLGVFTSRDIPLERLFAQWQGKVEGFTKGRDRSFHFGTDEYNITGMISHLGPQLSLACGTALAAKIREEKSLALAFTGEGGTSQGEFHEALNVASVWQLPVIFIVENNGYGLSTPVSEQYNCTDLYLRGQGYGMRALKIDGNNLLEVYNTVKTIATEIRENPEPVLIECVTFRQRGHEEASGTKYVPDDLMKYWKERDPVLRFEEFLLGESIITEDLKSRIKKEFKERIEQELAKSAGHSAPEISIQTELADLFRSQVQEVKSPKGGTKEMRFVDALHHGLNVAMEKHDELVLMGQDIADYGGVFKVTDGLMQKYGRDRVRNTPLCESAIIGTALGLSMSGMKAMVEMQFADFVTCGFNQIINNLAKIHYRWGAAADVVLRMPTGGGMGAGPFHSQSNEAWFFHTPGLKIVYPATPADAKGLLLAAFEDPNPYLLFEHKGLYRSMSGDVPEEYYTTEVGKANIARTGADATIITYGMGVKWALDIADTCESDIEVIDLRTLCPLDWDTILGSVQKTHRVLVLHEDNITGGIGGEISAYINEHCFEALDAPVVRCGSIDTPIPFEADLEKNYMASARLEEKLSYLLAY